MRRFAEGTPLAGFRQNVPTNRQGGLSCSSSSDTKRYRRLRCGKRARTTDCGSSCEHCGVVFREGKRVCPQCDALPRGPLQGFRQNIPTNRLGGLSCSSSSDTKRYRRLRCGKRGSYRRLSAALLFATLLFKSSVNSSTSPASSATPKGSRRMVVASASLPKRMGVKVMPQ